MALIRKAHRQDVARSAEIRVFCYRLNFYPVFQEDSFYFQELQVLNVMQEMEDALAETYVYDDDVVKGFVRVRDKEIVQLFVEPVLQGRGIGAALLSFAVKEKGANWLWALEKNERAVRFYERHGFFLTREKQLEEGTEEYLVRMDRKK